MRRINHKDCYIKFEKYRLQMHFNEMSSPEKCNISPLTRVLVHYIREFRKFREVQDCGMTKVYPRMQKSRAAVEPRSNFACKRL